MISFTIEKPKEISFGIQNVDLGADAYDRGYEAGEKEGYLNGYEAGAKEGAEVGYAKGEQEGFNKGVAEVETQNAKILTDCNTQLEGKGVESADTLEQVPQRIGEIETEGVDAWKHLTNLNNIFNGATFPADYELVINVPNLVNGKDIYYVIRDAKNIRKLTLKCGREDVTFQSLFAFSYCTSIKEIDLSQFSNTDVVKISKAEYMFYNDSALERIYGKLDFFACASLANTFGSCTALVDFEVVPNSICVSLSLKHCFSLSAKTIQSIVDGLADLTGATAQTITFSNIVGDKLTQAQKDTITAKNWTLVY